VGLHAGPHQFPNPFASINITYTYQIIIVRLYKFEISIKKEIILKATEHALYISQLLIMTSALLIFKLTCWESSSPLAYLYMKRSWSFLIKFNLNQRTTLNFCNYSFRKPCLAKLLATHDVICSQSCCHQI